MGRKPTGRPLAGFTLIEALVVVLLVVVTATVVLPGMRNLADSNRLRTEVRRLHSAIHLARSEAILRNLPVLMCPSPMASTGERVCSGIFSEGWIIFPDRNRDRQPDQSELNKKIELIRCHASQFPDERGRYYGQSIRVLRWFMRHERYRRYDESGERRSRVQNVTMLS